VAVVEDVEHAEHRGAAQRAVHELLQVRCASGPLVQDVGQGCVAAGVDLGGGPVGVVGVAEPAVEDVGADAGEVGVDVVDGPAGQGGDFGGDVGVGEGGGEVGEVGPQGLVVLCGGRHGCSQCSKGRGARFRGVGLGPK
jgi:hypothetical protein